MKYIFIIYAYPIYLLSFVAGFLFRPWFIGFMAGLQYLEQQYQTEVHNLLQEGEDEPDE